MLSRRSLTTTRIEGKAKKITELPKKQHSQGSLTKSNNDWPEERKFVLESLKTGEANDKELFKTLTAVQVELGMLKVKVAMWGAGGAGVIWAVKAAID